MTHRSLPAPLYRFSGLILVLAACSGDGATTTESDGSSTAGATTSMGTSPTTTGASTSSTATTADATTGAPTTGASTTDAITGSTGATTIDTSGDATTTTGSTTDGTASGTDTGGDTDTGGVDPVFPVHVGEVGPISPENPLQYPFACRAQDMGLGWPEVDNQDGVGLPIKDENEQVIGYSRHCGVKTRVDYFYKPTEPPPGGGLLPYDPQDPPADVAMIEIGGKQHRYVVRYERGTINRFVYGIAMIAPEEVDPEQPDISAWNQKLIFWFGGGVGIGHQQSSGLAVNRLKTEVYKDPYKDGPLNNPLLERGYAIAYSSGTVTDTTYNLRLTGETAVMVKQQFVARYAAPKYTFGIGGSGGAIQQFIYEQNHPDLLDGLVPTHAYPDMIGQTTRVGDCELLEHYFDVTDNANPKWGQWDNRRRIQGLNAIDGFAGSSWDLLGEGKPTGSSAGPGSSECIEGWRGLTPLAVNPLWVDTSEPSYKQILENDPAGFLATAWSYYDDLIDIFGADPKSGKGYARRTWDNVGVQYGLGALLAGTLTPDEFLKLNAQVGGYLAADAMVQEGFPFGSQDPNDFDIWSARNSTTSLGLQIAPRTEGDIEAMNRAYYDGLVFLGEIDAPIINILPYLEHELDMHNAKQPFAVRRRIEDAQLGKHDNHVIWALGDQDADMLALAIQAFDVLETWLDDQQKPPAAVDTCFDDGLVLLAAGDDVWNGVLGDIPVKGPCALKYPVHADSRMVAGEDISTDTFKCATKPLVDALADGTYGNIVWSAPQLAALTALFGDSGVCDYSKPDLGRPEDL